MLSKTEVAERYPDVAGEWVGGMLTDTDGRGEPFVAVPALARAAQKLGATVIENCAVRTLDVADGKVTGVVTESGLVKCNQVVLAAGAWSTFFASNQDQKLPQLAVRSTVARTSKAPDLGLPNVSSPGLTMRRRDEFRSEGRVAVSKDLASTAQLVAILLGSVSNNDERSLVALRNRSTFTRYCPLSSRSNAPASRKKLKRIMFALP